MKEYITSNLQRDYLEYLQFKKEGISCSAVFQKRLHSYLKSAYRTLTGIPSKSKDIFQFSEELNKREDRKKNIKQHIEYALALVGKDNLRFGVSAVEQDKFFHRYDEQSVFFIYLFQSIQNIKHKIIKRTCSESITGVTIPYFQNLHHVLKRFEKKQSVYFSIDNKKVFEKDLYAAGVFYAVSFLIDAYKTNDKVRIKRIVRSINHFRFGPSFAAVYGDIGSKTKSKKKKYSELRAQQIFQDLNVHKNNSDYNLFLWRYIRRLKKEGIQITRNMLNNEILK